MPTKGWDLPVASPVFFAGAIFRTKCFR